MLSMHYFELMMHYFALVMHFNTWIQSALILIIGVSINTLRFSLMI